MLRAPSVVPPSTALLLLVTSSAYASDFEVTCDEFAPGRRARLEARLRFEADLLTLPAGTLHLTCPNGRVAARFEFLPAAAPGPLHERGRDPQLGLEDDLLVVALELLGEMDERLRASPVPEKERAVLPTVGRKIVLQDETWYRTPPSKIDDADTLPDEAWTFDARVGYETLAAESAGAVAADLALTRWLGPAWGLGLHGAAGKGLGLPDDLSATLLRVGILLEYRATSWASFALGPTLSQLSFSSVRARAADPVSELPELELGLNVVPFGTNPGWLLGTSVRFRPSERVAQIDDATFLRVPVWSLCATIGARFGFDD